MNSFRETIERLEKEHRLQKNEYAMLLSPELPEKDADMLRARARALTDRHFGNKVYIRGLVEVTNVCRNNCYYCGLRRDNRSLHRYTLSPEIIEQCCRRGYAAGFRTFVLQGGENPAFSRDVVVETVQRILSSCPDSAVTLSLGEWDDASYAAFKEAGASRYLLRHETYNPDHYSRLHPEDMSLSNRLRCLDTLKRLGYQTGTGIMVGSPFQTIDDITEDLLYIERLQPEMIGIGPFIPNSATPFAPFAAGSVNLTTRLISILRLMRPSANIPSTTALATVSPGGRNAGLLAGANVVMPNLSPPDLRKDYSLYDNKAATGAEAAEGIALLAKEIAEIGLEISKEKGDYEHKL